MSVGRWDLLLPLLASTALTAVSLTVAPADARPIERAHLVTEFVDGPYDCDGLTTAVDEGTVQFNLLANLRGSSPFPFNVENVNGIIVTTNLETGGTFTRKIADSGHDHTIVDNGDGTISVTVHAQGVIRSYDQFGKLVLKDPGSLWTSLVLDYNGTPGDPSDDTVIEGSMQVVRPPTGKPGPRDRDFCTDLVTYTSAA
jgi:hypothetical protein